MKKSIPICIHVDASVLFPEISFMGEGYIIQKDRLLTVIGTRLQEMKIKNTKPSRVRIIFKKEQYATIYGIPLEIAVED